LAASRPSVSRITVSAPTQSGETLTVTGTNLNHLRSLWIGQRRLRFTVVSPTRVTATIPPSSEQATRISLVFATITLSWKRGCKGCTSDDWQPAG
jgi:IPT/TIG domain